LKICYHTLDNEKVPFMRYVMNEVNYLYDTTHYIEEVTDEEGEKVGLIRLIFQVDI